MLPTKVLGDIGLSVSDVKPNDLRFEGLADLACNLSLASRSLRFCLSLVLCLLHVSRN